jgi:hypothetical protein
MDCFVVPVIGRRFSPVARNDAEAAELQASAAARRLFHCRTADELSLLFDKSCGGAQTDCEREKRKFWHPTTPETGSAPGTRDKTNW